MPRLLRDLACDTVELILYDRTSRSSLATRRQAPWPTARTAIISVDGHVKASRTGFRAELRRDSSLPRRVRRVGRARRKAAGVPGRGEPRSRVRRGLPVGLRQGACRELERVGVVAEVLFPNGQPFQANRLEDFSRAGSRELADAGRQAYNRWLADFCAEARRTTGGPGVDLVRRHRPSGRRRPLGQGARPGRDHDAAVEPGRDLLLRPGARPGLGSRGGGRPPGQPARRQRCAGLQPARVRVHHHARDGALVLLGAFLVAAHGGWCLRSVPRPAGGVRGDGGLLDRADDQAARAVHRPRQRLDGLRVVDEP